MKKRSKYILVGMLVATGMCCGGFVAAGPDYLKYPWAIAVIAFAVAVNGEPRLVSLVYTAFNMLMVIGLAFAVFMLELMVDVPGEPLIIGTLYGIMIAMAYREGGAIRVALEKSAK